MNESRSRQFEFDRIIGGYSTPTLAAEVTQDIDLTRPSATYGYFYAPAKVTTHSRYQLSVLEGTDYTGALRRACDLASRWNSEAAYQENEEGVLHS